jgi:ParB family chromosome partitioning protein
MSTATAKKAATKGIGLAGLDDFDVGSLMQAGAPKAAAGSDGKPLEIPLDQIIEDPDQPRSEDNPGFSHESLSELAESIVESGGVKTPISVRSKNAEGFYLINHGARRFRSSKLAKMKTIKAFIDDKHDEYDQAIENIQRENFTPMEIATFIAKREKKGDSRVSIAKRLGKSKAFVTQHASLLSMSPGLREVYDEDRCRDVLALYELVNLEKKFPVEVGEFIEEAPEITRSAVEALKASTKAAAKVDAEGDEEGEGEGDGEGEEGAAGTKEKAPKTKKASVMVKHRKSLFVLRFDIRPSALHLGWIEDPETGATTEVELSDLRIDSIVEG